jgi:anti-sigma factor RsiW
MNELDRTWAETQVEAMADGSLSPTAENRMRALMARDPELGRRVELSRQLQRDLARLARRPAPRGLFRRLWNIPSANRAVEFRWLPAAALAGLAAIAVGIGLFNRPSPTAEQLAQQAAAQDVALAMGYLQKGLMMATGEVNQNVGAGMMKAYVVSRNALDMEEDDD